MKNYSIMNAKFRKKSLTINVEVPWCFSLFHHMASLLRGNHQPAFCGSQQTRKRWELPQTDKQHSQKPTENTCYSFASLYNFTTYVCIPKKN